MVKKFATCISRRLDACVSVEYVFDRPVLVGLGFELAVQPPR